MIFNCLKLAVLYFTATAAFRFPCAPKRIQIDLTSKSISKFIIGTFVSGALVTTPVAFNFPSMLSPMIVNAATTKSVFDGLYNDPNHPGCLRKITSKDGLVTIIGSEELDGSKQWTVQAKEDFPGTIFVDFSPKGGPSDLLGVYDERADGIKWPDGNFWNKIKK